MPIDYTRRVPRPTMNKTSEAGPETVSGLEPPTSTRIDYTRRDRSGRSAATGVQSSPPPPPPRSGDEAIGRPRVERNGAGTQRIVSRAESARSGVETSTLAASYSAIYEFVPGMRSHIDGYRARLTDEFASILTSAADISPMLRRLDATFDRLRDLMKARFPDQFGTLYNSAGGPTPPAEVWLSAVTTLNADLESRRLPLTSGGRAKDWERVSAQYKGLACHYQPLVDELHRSAYDSARMALEAYSAGRRDVLFCEDLTTFPAVEVPTDALPQVLSVSKPGLGPLMVSLGGRLGAAEVDLTLMSADGKSSSAPTVSTTPTVYPAILDLGRSGGFRTVEPLMAERVILGLLAALPADQLAIRVFDPQKLGDSAAFLYGLDDVMDRVIGDKVKTTDREIDELLQDTEEHITRVTQKYLQGEHATLTEYNIAARMVTEPYRVLLLYGFPAGFARQGHLDHDRLERLAKIIDGGSRAGVFTVIVADDIEGAGPTTPSANDGNARGYIDSLPHFGNGKILDSQAHSYLVGADPADRSIRLAATTNGSGVSFQPRSTFTRLGPSELELRWAPVLTSSGEQDIRRSLMIERIKQNFAGSTGTVIRPGWVASLSDDPLAADPYDPATWWRNTTVTGASACIGQLGATKVAQIGLHSEDGGVGALIGGRPGSGKSVLMHAMIMSLVTEYSPSDLELYLIDFKEGVEFKRYSDHRLPHAKAIAIDAEREFGIAVLEGMVTEIERRADLFKGFSANITKIDDYRKQRGSEALARQITVIDEFQKLFERDDQLAQRASHLIERILREGRAFGLHIVLASQTMHGLQGLDRHVLSLIPTRIALRMSAGDSEMVLGEGNPEARDLARAGEGIINTKQGHPDANERFQTTLWHDRTDDGESGTDVEDVLAAIRIKADRSGFRGEPRVYAGDGDATLSMDMFSEEAMPIGLPVTLAPAMRHGLRREGGANLLVANDSYGPILAAVLAVIRAGARVRILDFIVGDEEWSSIREVLLARANVSIGGRRDVSAAIDEALSVVEERVEFEDYRNPSEFVVLFGVHRARDLDPDSEYDDDSANAKLTRILRDGPDVGVHVLAWTDRGGILGRRMSSQAQREFGLRLVGPSSMEDSQLLIDSDAATTLKRGQSVFDDHERGVTTRVVNYGIPSTDAVREFVR